MSIFLSSYNENYQQINNSGIDNSNNFSSVFNFGSGHDFNHLLDGRNINDYIFTTSEYRETSSLVLTTSVASSTVEGLNVKLLKFIIWGILGSILAVLGFLGNTLSMVVLHRRQMRSSTSYYLLSLAIYDNGILLGMVVYFCLPALASYTFVLKDYMIFLSLTIPYGYPLSLSAQMGSIYTCVGFTVERFIAVCRPLHAANTCTKSRTIRAIILIFVWSVVYNIPRFFHFKVSYIKDEQTYLLNSSRDTRNYSDIGLPWVENVIRDNTSSRCWSNLSSDLAFNHVIFNISDSDMKQFFYEALPNVTTPSYFPTEPQRPSFLSIVRHEETEFASDPTFKHLYLIYFQLFFMFLLPFLIILIMNIGLIRAVRGSRSMHQSMCASARKEHNLTVMLISVIVVFLVCQFPTIIDNILVAVVGEFTLKTNDAYMCFYILCTFMVEINAASNFLLYCFFGKKFRLMLLNILGIKRKHHQVAYRSTVCKSRTNGTRTYEIEVSVM